jgi:hypothetical protein
LCIIIKNEDDSDTGTRFYRHIPVTWIKKLYHVTSVTSSVKQITSRQTSPLDTVSQNMFHNFTLKTLYTSRSSCTSVNLSSLKRTLLWMSVQIILIHQFSGMVAFKDPQEHAFESTPLSPDASSWSTSHVCSCFFSSNKVVQDLFIGQNNIVVKRTKHQEANF